MEEENILLCEDEAMGFIACISALLADPDRVYVENKPMGRPAVIAKRTPEGIRVAKMGILKRDSGGGVAETSFLGDPFKE